MTADQNEIAPKHIAAVEQQSQLRGQIISSFSQVEFLLVHLVYQARIIRDYWSLGLEYRRRLSGKIEQVERLVDAEGPIHKYRDRVIAIVRQLASFKDDRDYMAHAYCSIGLVGDQYEFHYRMMRNNEKNELNVEYRSYSPDGLQNLQREMTVITDSFMKLFREIYMNEGLEEHWTFG